MVSLNWNWVVNITGISNQCKETNIELYSKILDLININKIGVKDEIFDIVYREIHNL